MVKNELRCISAGGGSRHCRSPRQNDENSAYEVAAPPLIRGEGARVPLRTSPTAKSLSTLPTKDENVNTFQIIQCHQGMEKGRNAGCHLSRCGFEELFSIKFLKINVLCCSE